MASMDDNKDLYIQKLSYRDTGAPCQCLAQPWFIHAQHPIYQPRHACLIEPMNCGERVFGAIAADLKDAKHSVDIITWGFDPGMVLVREGTAEAGQRYGDLLKEIATRKENPVKVRLLIWHDDVASQQKMNNMPSYYGRLYPAIGSAACGFYSDAHQEFNAAWCDQVCSGALTNIHFHVRDVPGVHMIRALWDETLPDGLVLGGTGLLTAMYPAHHQKMVLIDYEHPDVALGYVMGHNSITDFWDSEDHHYRDTRRERIYRKKEKELREDALGKKLSHNDIAYGWGQTEEGRRARAKMVQSYIDNNSHIAKPYQDVSCRVRGPLLYDLNHNFCQAWQESTPPSALFTDICRVLPLPVVKAAVYGVRKISTAVSHNEMDPGFIERRAKILSNAFKVANGQHSAQLVRTQPMHGEKGAKECYANLTRQMLHYMFIQNQYIQYTAWAEHLIKCVANLRAAGYRKPIYVFLLTSTPEREQMDRPTYEVASRIGTSATMKVEHDEAVRKARKNRTKPPITPEEMADHGINVVMGSLWTCAQGEKLMPNDYEEIYIHAKVAVVDDAAFTIGSANLNLRSMAMDSELNVLSQAKDVAYELRCKLFEKCATEAGPAQFGNMGGTLKKWQQLASKNADFKKTGVQLTGQLLPFYVDRKPGSPVV